MTLDMHLEKAARLGGGGVTKSQHMICYCISILGCTPQKYMISYDKLYFALHISHKNG